MRDSGERQQRESDGDGERDGFARGCCKDVRGDSGHECVCVVVQGSIVGASGVTCAVPMKIDITMSASISMVCGVHVFKYSDLIWSTIDISPVDFCVDDDELLIAILRA
jgi:hypothetical protein